MDRSRKVECLQMSACLREPRRVVLPIELLNEPCGLNRIRGSLLSGVDKAVGCLHFATSWESVDGTRLPCT